MKTFIIALLLGIIIGAGGLWFAEQRQIKERTNAAAQNAKRLVDAQLEALDLQTDKIRKELAETGRVVRRKASALGEKVADH